MLQHQDWNNITFNKNNNTNNSITSNRILIKLKMKQN